MLRRFPAKVAGRSIKTRICEPVCDDAVTLSCLKSDGTGFLNLSERYCKRLKSKNNMSGQSSLLDSRLISSIEMFIVVSNLLTIYYYQLLLSVVVTPVRRL